jgi:uncharacterized protein YecE (DUF72 family)
VTEYRIGTTGWGYDAWKGGFYAPGTEAGDYLAALARVFHVVEVDMPYHSVPTRAQITRWALETPPSFTFCPKMLGGFTHDARLRVTNDALDRYVALYEPLRKAGKLGPFLIELPPTFRGQDDAEALRTFLSMMGETPFAVELRDPYWWRQETYELLREHKAPLVWSFSDVGWTPPVVTADWLYCRVIGDHQTIHTFGKLQRDMRGAVMQMRERITTEGAAARFAYVFINNHLEGFAPQSARTMAELLGAPPPDLRAAKSQGQRGLFDF